MKILQPLKKFHFANPLQKSEIFDPLRKSRQRGGVYIKWNGPSQPMLKNLLSKVTPLINSCSVVELTNKHI